MRIVAISVVFNEEDIIVPALRYLIQQGIFVYVIDNWSTDRTAELAAEFVGRGVVAIEKFPAVGPEPAFSWRGALTRVEQLAAELEADWFVFQSPDEIRVPPWPGVSMRDGIERVDAAGYNCIDHAVMNFPPVDNAYRAGTSFENYFRHYEWSDVLGHFKVLNSWKNTGRPIALAPSGGHEVWFEGRRVYPYKFLLKHYPIRSQAHGERKVLQERRPRWAAERLEGWHTHYDHVDAHHSFLRPPSELALFSEADFPTSYLPDGLEIIDWGDLALTGALLRKEQTIRNLSAAINEVQASRAWRLVERFRSLRVRIAPPGSRRELAWYSFVRLLGCRG